MYENIQSFAGETAKSGKNLIKIKDKMEQIHMNKELGVFCEGWTRCGRPKWVKRTNKWKECTCKQCLTHKNFG